MMKSCSNALLLAWSFQPTHWLIFIWVQQPAVRDQHEHVRLQGLEPVPYQRRLPEGFHQDFPVMLKMMLVNVLRPSFDFVLLLVARTLRPGQELVDRLNLFKMQWSELKLLLNTLNLIKMQWSELKLLLNTYLYLILVVKQCQLFKINKERTTLDPLEPSKPEMLPSHLEMLPSHLEMLPSHLEIPSPELEEFPP